MTTYDDDAPQPNAPARRRRRRGGGCLTTLLVAFVVLLVVLGVAVFFGDRAARDAAQTEIARQVDSQLGNPVGTTDVEFLGSWFLLQAVRGDVDVAFDTRVPVGDVSAPVSDGLLQDVKVPVVQLVQEQSGTVTVGSSEATVDLDWATANALLAAQGAPVTLAAADDAGTARISGSLDVAGRQVPIDSEVTVTLETADGATAVRLTPTDLPTVRGVTVGDGVFYDLALPELPLGLEVTAVTTTENGLRVTAGGTDTSVSF